MKTESSLKIIGVRHAESKANIGEVFEDQATIELSLEGAEQAKDLVDKLEMPDLILVSKFRRTQDTAFPFISANPEVPVATSILIHEFHYLSSDRFKDLGLNKNELRKQYWDNMDPYYKDDYGADKTVESFAEFAERVHNFLVYIKSLKENNTEHILIFTHGLFLRMLWLITREFGDLFVSNNPKIKSELMKNLMYRFRNCEEELKPGNASVNDLSKDVNLFISRM